MPGNILQKVATACLSVFLLVFSHALHAQKVLFKDNFDTYLNYKIPGWTANPAWRAGIMYLIVGSTDTACLCNTAPNVISQQRVAGISDCTKSPANIHINPNALVYTPRIDMTGITNAWIKYESYFQKANHNGIFEDAFVEVSVNGGTTWNVVQNVPRNQSMSAMQTYYLDISAFAGNSNVRIGFRYKDNNQQIGGWAIDNVEVFQPSDKDLKLLSVTPADTLSSFAAINTGYIHKYTVQNMGTTVATDFVVKYKLDNGNIIDDSVKGVSINPYETYVHTHKIPDTISTVGLHHVIAWVEMAGDTIHNNDTIYTDIRGAYFMPKKMVAVEEGTGTWNVWAPRGHVYMKQLEAADYNACQIAVHDTDPMSIEAYNDYLYNLRQLFVPYFLLDRYIDATPDSLLPIVKNMQEHFGFAELAASSYTYPDKVTVNVAVKPAIDMKGDFRLLLVLTEDGLTGTTHDWDQKNIYSNGQEGPMGGYENKPYVVPAADMVYNYVARDIAPVPEGADNLPDELIHNNVYNVSFSSAISPVWNKNKIHAVVMLLRHDDSTILNSTKIPFTLGVQRANMASIGFAQLYPNPSQDKTTLQFLISNEENVNITVTDISGRVVMSFAERTYDTGTHEISIPTADLYTGIYIVTLTAGDSRKALKLQVVH